MLILKRRESFCASHRLFNPNWDDAKNSKIFGKCSHINGHGHNYILEVAVTGDLDPETGFIFSLQELKTIIQEEILDEVDHKHLNFDVLWLKGKIPTTEVLVKEIGDKIENRLKKHSEKVKLYSVTVWETPKNYVTQIRAHA